LTEYGKFAFISNAVLKHNVSNLFINLGISTVIFHHSKTIRPQLDGQMDRNVYVYIYIVYSK